MLSQQPLDAPCVTKDGVTVAKEVELTNSFGDIGCSRLWYIPNNCSETASDGTTATGVTCGLYKEGMKSIGSGVNPMDFKISINTCCKYVLNILTKLFSQGLMNVHAIGYVARNVSNGDKTIAALITKAIQEVGIDALIKIESGFIYVDELVVIEGCEIEKGYTNKSFSPLNRKNSLAASNNNRIDNSLFSTLSIEYSGSFILLCKDTIHDPYTNTLCGKGDGHYLFVNVNLHI